MADQFLFSGEPLPLAPHPSDDSVELARFHGKLLDYLRRLSQKVSAPEVYSGGEDSGGAGSVESFAAGMSGDQIITPAGGWTDIEWDDPLRADESFSHDATGDAEEITCVESGFFVCLLQVRYSERQFDLRLANGDGDGLYYSYLQHQSITTNHAALSVPFFAAAGGVIKAQIENTLSSDYSVVASGTCITIMRLGSLAGSGSVPGVDPEDDPWWKYTL